MIYDANGQVQYVQLWGTVDQCTWQNLVSVLANAQPCELSVQDLQSGELLGLERFESNHWKIG
ncbi:hypothetical protein [Rosistilla carotiformis]|nr:hypothetical protein [Rosistilla carotiformis]